MECLLESLADSLSEPVLEYLLECQSEYLLECLSDSISEYISESLPQSGGRGATRKLQIADSRLRRFGYLERGDAQKRARGAEIPSP